MDNRKAEIVALVNREGYVSLQSLREAFPNVSDVTLRKDLSYLDSTFQLVRVHGGARSLPTAIGALDNFYTRLSVNVEEKRGIASKAVQILRKNNSLYIASGTTCNEFAKILPDMELQVFTDGIATALELAKYSNIETTLFGGVMDTNLLRVQGARIFQELENLYFDYAFFGADGYLPERGFIFCNAYSCELLQTVRKHANKLVIMMDSSKVNAVRAARFFPAKDVDIVIGDGKLDSATLKSFSHANVMVL